MRYLLRAPGQARRMSPGVCATLQQGAPLRRCPCSRRALALWAIAYEGPLGLHVQEQESDRHRYNSRVTLQQA